MNRLLLLLVLLSGCVLPAESELYPDDDDSAQSFASTARADSDGDGMDDSWENQNGYDPNDPTDATVDDDGDGRDALQEFTDDTDPHQYDGPDSPFPTDPADGGTVTVDQPDLTFANATAPLGDPLTYTIEVYADAALTTLVTSATGLAEGAGSTTWTVDVALTEDATVYWRAAATDPYITGEWCPAVSFTVDALGAPPTIPVPVAPLTGAVVPAGAVTLEWEDATSPDGLALQYRVTLYDADGISTIDTALFAGEAVDPHETWTVTQALATATEYRWTVEAIDSASRSSGPSTAQVFGYDSTNDPPSAPAFTAPRDGDQLEDTSPTVTLEAGVDPESGPVAHTLELSRDVNFAPVAWTLESEPSTDASVTIDLDDVVLDADITWHLRARAEDQNGGTSDWAVISVFVRGPNDAPSVPTLGEPVPNRIADQTGAFFVSGSVDPEGDAITYEIVVAADASLGTVVEEGSLTSGDSWTSTVAIAGGHWWTARAVDSAGAASAWATPVYFVALDPSWGCAISPRQPSLPLLLLLVLTLGIRRSSPERRP